MLFGRNGKKQQIALSFGDFRQNFISSGIRNGSESDGLTENIMKTSFGCGVYTKIHFPSQRIKSIAQI